jgi:hypothetical protein
MIYDPAQTIHGGAQKHGRTVSSSGPDKARQPAGYRQAVGVEAVAVSLALNPSRRVSKGMRQDPSSSDRLFR